MSQQQHSYSEKKRYFFTRAKDTHKENGSSFITMFTRLTKEISRTSEQGTEKITEQIWVDLEETREKQAARRFRELPNGIHTYLVPERVFQELVRVSGTCPKELFHITPIYTTNRFRKFKESS